MSFWDQVVANPRFWLSAAVLLGVTAIECLLALWAATARKGRLERVVVVWFAIMVLVPIRAYEPALMFTVIAGLIIVLVRTMRHATRERSAGERWWSGWLRFSLADIFTLTLFVCTILAMGALCRAHPRYFTGTLLTLPIPIVVSLSHFAAAGPYRTRMSILTLSALVASGGFAIWTRAAPYFPSPHGMSQHEARELCLHAILLGLLILLSYFVVLLLRSLWNGRHDLRDPDSRMGKLIPLSSVATLLAFVAWYYCTDMLRSVPAAMWNLVQIAWATSPLAVLASVVAGATFATRGCRGDWGRRWQRASVAASAGAFLLVALPLAWFYWQMYWLPPIRPFAAGGPTNYDRLIAIAHRLQDYYPQRGGIPFDSEAQTLLDEASALLKTPNYIPAAALEAESQRPPPDSALQYHDLFAVIGAFETAATGARDTQHHDRTADLALDLLRFGTMFQSGGTYHSRLGWYAHGGAFRIIDASALTMSPAKRREVIQALEDVLQQREDPKLQAARATAYHDRSGGWQARFSSVLYDLAPRPAATTPGYSEEVWAELALRATQIKLAIIQFQINGRQPTALEELVPKCLDKVPLDPYDGKPLRIRSEGLDSYVLYSVGRDGIDNGGNFATDMTAYYNQTGFDLKLPLP